MCSCPSFWKCFPVVFGRPVFSSSFWKCFPVVFGRPVFSFLLLFLLSLDFYTFLLYSAFLPLNTFVRFKVNEKVCCFAKSTGRLLSRNIVRSTTSLPLFDT